MAWVGFLIEIIGAYPGFPCRGGSRGGGGGGGGGGTGGTCPLRSSNYIFMLRNRTV